MKYGEEGNMSSSNPKPAPVGIIKKSSLYRGSQLLKQSHAINNEANAVVNINCDDLTVVGYSSNLYRDDFMALKLESRDILIPWNGDENLLIDRYDCRGYLYDLEPYDADLMSNERRNPKYTSEEVEIEQACDAERYMFLRDDDEQTELDNNDNTNNNRDSDTDDNSRLYACVGFNYDSKSQHQKETDKNGTDNDAVSKELEQQPKEKLFVPDDALQLPLGMLIPETVKMNQIVMKTASFVAKQGLQMEILLKTKQANNTQFDFLNFDNHLNPYYKHLIQLIRDNKIDPMVYLIEPKEEEVKLEKNNNEQDSDDENTSDDDDNYLHPLLFKKIESTEKKKEPEENKVIDETSNASKEEDNKSNEVKMEDEEGLVEDACSKERENGDDEKFEEPPEGVEKTIIDKLAEYVSRNGREFEKTMLKKDEQRFGFVKNDHKYYKYYCMMVEKAIKSIGESSRGVVEKTKEEVVVKEKADENSHTSSKRAIESSSEDSEKASSGSSSSSGSDSESDGAKDKEKETKKDKEKTRKRSRERSREREREKKRKKEKKSHTRSKSSSHHHRHHHHKSESSSSSKSKKKHHHRKKSKSRH